MSCSMAAMAVHISDTLPLYAAVSIGVAVLALADIVGRIITTNRPSSVTKHF